MAKKILILAALILSMTAALVAYSMTCSVPDVSGAASGFKQQIVAKTKELATPVLERAGVDVEKLNADDMNIVEKQMENATDKVNEATQALSR